MDIITDSREQLPYWKFTIRALIVGDYTTRNLLNKFHIERKSLSDLYQTLTSGNNRFKYELFRAAYHGIQLEVYIEGSRKDFIEKRFPKGNERKFSSDGLEKMVKTFETKYHLKFHWHTNRQATLQSVYNRLKEEEKMSKIRRKTNKKL